MNLTLFDLDGTLLPLDSDHAFGQFLVHIGWADAAEHGRRIDRLPEECVFVDDLGGNLKPARDLGMSTVLHTDAESTIAALEPLLGVSLR